MFIYERNNTDYVVFSLKDTLKDIGFISRRHCIQEGSGVRKILLSGFRKMGKVIF